MVQSFSIRINVPNGIYLTNTQLNECRDNCIYVKITNANAILNGATGNHHHLIIDVTFHVKFTRFAFSLSLLFEMLLVIFSKLDTPHNIAINLLSYRLHIIFQAYLNLFIRSQTK